MTVYRLWVGVVFLSVVLAGQLRADSFNLASVLTQLRTSLGRCSVPFAKRRGLNYSFELFSRPFTFSDLYMVIAAKLADIKGDLKELAVVARLVFDYVKNYIREKPANAAIIGSSLAVAVFIARCALCSIAGAGQCPYCESTRHRRVVPCPHHDS